jgi:hypothetical protein
MSLAAEEEEGTAFLPTVLDMNFFGSLIDGPESEDEVRVAEVCLPLIYVSKLATSYVLDE